LRHFQAVKKRGLLPTLGLPSKSRKYDIRLKPKDQLQARVCRVIVDGVPCIIPSDRRGLCDRHYAAIWQRKDLRLDDFGTPLVTSSDVRSRRFPRKGICRLVVADQECDAVVEARGLCSRHYDWLRSRDMGLFERLAEPTPTQIVYTLRIRQRPGRCRVAENGTGCGEAANHYNVISGRPDAFAVIAAPTKAKKSPQYAIDPESPANICHLRVDGLACTAPIEYRGLCMRHYKKLRSNAQVRLLDFLTVETEPNMLLKPTQQLNAIVCRLIVDGQPCQESSFTRGLCRIHYRTAQRYQKLDALGSSPRAPVSSAVRTLHVYLDKNILFDWCDAHAFATTGQKASCELVERVQCNEVMATISASAVTSSYNHIRHRAARPLDEAGRALPEDQAEALARATVARMLDGAWRIQVVEAHELRTVLGTASEHSYEDALEWAAYQKARSQQHGPRCFVTRDADFSEGVPPWSVVQQALTQKAF